MIIDCIAITVFFTCAGAFFGYRLAEHQVNKAWTEHWMEEHRDEMPQL